MRNNAYTEGAAPGGAGIVADAVELVKDFLKKLISVGGNLR